jgi:hypothetical protein
MSYDEETLARLLRLLPPAPAAWVAAAQQLPAARATLDDVVARVEADAEFRARLVADLEAALAQAGYEPNRALVEAVRLRLQES